MISHLKIQNITLGILFLAVGMLKSYGQADTLKASAARQDTVAVTAAKAKPWLASQVTYTAKDSTIISMTDKKIRMYGGSVVKYEDLEITADIIEMSIDRKEIFASGRKDSAGQLTGKPVFKQGEETINCTEIKFNFVTKKAFVVDVSMKQEPEGEIHSHYTKRDSTGTLNIRDGKYTTCDADEPHFYFNITKGMMVPNKMIVTGPLFLVVEGIPLYPIGLPFGFLPKQEKRTSGILMPKYGEERSRGFFLRDGGYYFAINDKLDLAVTGGIFSRGSWQLGAQSRYRKIYKFNGNIGFNVATNVSGERDLPDFSKKRDFSVTWAHSQDPKADPYNMFNASVNFSTSSYDRLNTNTDYTQDGMNPMDRMTNQKSSSITYGRKFANPLFNFTAKVGHSQNSLDSTVVLTAPSGTFTVGRFYPFRWSPNSTGKKWYEKFEMRYTANFENKVKAREDSIFMPEIFAKMKNGFQHEVPLSASFKPIQNMTLTPSLSYIGIAYFSYLEKSWDPDLEKIIINRFNKLNYIQALTPSVSLSYNPRIYGFFNFKRGKVKTIRHVMSPSLSFNYRPDLGYDFGKYQRTLLTMSQDDQGKLYADEHAYSIFDEGIYRLPSIAGRSGNISFSLGNNVEMKLKNPADTTAKETKVKLLESLSINTSYDIFRDSMNLSPISLQGRTTILDQFNLSFRSTFNPYAYESITQGKRTYYQTVNRYEVTKTGKLLRMTDANFSLDFSLPLKQKQQQQQASAPAGAAQQKAKPAPAGPQLSTVSDFKTKWSTTVSYNFQYSKPYEESKITQSLRLNGQLQLSEKWSINGSSGYDFINQKFTYTTLAIARNLHCWQMNISVVPFGEYKSYTFSISARGNLLKDIKYEKRKDWRDQ